MKITICPECGTKYCDDDFDYRCKCPACGHVFKETEKKFLKAVSDAVEEMKNTKRQQ